MLKNMVNVNYNIAKLKLQQKQHLPMLIKQQLQQQQEINKQKVIVED